GNIFLDANRSADIPEDENCSLFITGLSSNANVHTLLEGVRDIGRVFAVHINTPDPWRGHLTCASKISFFDRPSAYRFFRRFSTHGFPIPAHPGFLGTVVWNRVRTPTIDKPAFHTRVLLISGPTRIVNSVALDPFFRSKRVFEVDEVIDHGSQGAWALVEFRFGSYRSQAEAAKMALERELPEQVRVELGRDPCDL
ncbi:hypothetical protein CONLIGDRAFT_703825, partial [Coniochaeta ligniaria NRRL 30616]